MIFVLLRAARRFAPDAVAQIDIIPAHRQHLAAPCAGQQQHAQDVSGLPVGMIGQRSGDPRQFVTDQIALALSLFVFLDALARIVASHLPHDRQREHFRKHPDRGVGASAMPGLGDLAVQPVDVRKADIGHLGVLAEVRPDVVAQHAAIVGSGARALTGQVLLFEAVAQIVHRRCQTDRLDLGQRIATGIDHTPQISRLLAGVGRRPIQKTANRLAPFASARGPVVQDERSSAVGGDAQTEPGDLAVEVHLVAGGWRLESPDHAGAEIEGLAARFLVLFH